ncbi:restriction endonuclease subunit S [Vibrio cholerae]|nr:restriction endonuclease subunit S [Vibrio cholerae]EJL6596677.1 restriction endonuclease subunit S [Vibrio cholerae]
MLGNKINNIPDGWKVEHIEDFASIKTGTGDTQDREDGGKYPFFVRSNTIERVNKYTFDGEGVLTSGDGVGVGKIYHYVNGKFHYHQRVYNIHNFKPHVLGRYFYQFFRYRFFQRVSRMSAKGSVDSVRMEMIAKMSILIPTIEEQQKIADILSTVDKKIDLIEQKIAETENLKTSLMQKLFSEGVGVQDDNGDWQPHSEFKESMYGSIPLCWEVSTFKKLLKSKDILGIQDGNHGESHPVSSDFVSEGVPFITANKISSRNKLLTKSAKKISHEQYKSLRIGFSKPGDVILTHKGTVGLTAIVSEEDGELMMSPQTTYYRLGKNSCLINSFLYYFFQSSGFKRVLNQKSQQSTRAYIGITKQAELSVLIPEPKEQKQISSILNAVDSKLDLLTEQKIEVKKLKKGLMQKLLTGEWRVPVEETEAA